MYIDSHCHLTHERMAPLGEAAQIVQNAKDAGVEGMLNICCRISDEFPEVLETARQFDNVWCTIGTHPHDAGNEAEKAITQDRLVEMARSDEKIVGIGETGLDYYYNNSPAKDQQESFRKHIRAAIETDLPLIIHARDADDDLMRIVKEEGAGTDLTGVMHCFSSSPALGEAALDFGFYISFSGIVTFKKATELQDFARTVPLDKMLIETDAPFLAPEPHRGKINEPALVTHTAGYIAKLCNVSKEEIATHTKNNFFRLFSKALV